MTSLNITLVLSIFDGPDQGSVSCNDGPVSLRSGERNVDAWEIVDSVRGKGIHENHPGGIVKVTIGRAKDSEGLF